MELKFDGRIFCVSRPETEFDVFVKDFVSMLEKAGVKYVIVSGYVAILFGRSRNSEDVDVLIDDVAFGRFERLWAEASRLFECINSSNPKDAFDNYLSSGLALRFSAKGRPIPNMEVKFAKTELDAWTISNAVKVNLNGLLLNTSPLELQIPYKLYLGSFKDIEDAKHLWLVTKNHLDKRVLDSFIGQMGVKKEAAKWLV